jgi:hypothetical protein
LGAPAAPVSWHAAQAELYTSLAARGPALAVWTGAADSPQSSPCTQTWPTGAIRERISSSTLAITAPVAMPKPSSTTARTLFIITCHLKIGRYKNHVLHYSDCGLAKKPNGKMKRK